MLCRLITPLALAVLTASASAQTLQRATTPTVLEYTMGQGYSVEHRAVRSGPKTIFNNRDGTIYYYTALRETDEYVDEGSFHLTGINGTEQVNGLTFDYCSTVPDPSGNAIAAEVRLYDEVVIFAGVTGWIDANNRNEKCVYFLSNLPGDTSLGNGSCWTIQVDLSGGFECTLPQEQSVGSMNTFGHSVMYSDALFLHATGPLLDSRIGLQLGNDYGISDWFEFYDMSKPLGSEYLGAWWAGDPRALGSFLMSLDGNPTDTVAYYSANPGTADVLELQAGVEVRPSQVANWTITNPAAGQSYALIASTGTADLAALVGGNAHLLVNWMGAPLLPAPLVMAGGSYAQTLPAALPPTINVQAAEYAGALTPGNITAMSNGLAHSN